MSLTDVINPQVGLGLMLCANRWVSLMNLYPKKGYIITAAKNSLNSQQ